MGDRYLWKTICSSQLSYTSPIECEVDCEFLTAIRPTTPSRQTNEKNLNHFSRLTLLQASTPEELTPHPILARV